MATSQQQQPAEVSVASQVLASTERTRTEFCLSVIPLRYMKELFMLAAPNGVAMLMITGKPHSRSMLIIYYYYSLPLRRKKPSTSLLGLPPMII